MTFGELKAQALQLIFSYSTAGTVIPATYNNQADYIAMIPGLVNAAQMEIATTARRIPASKKLSDMTFTQEGNDDVYTLPADCWQLMQGGFYPGSFHEYVNMLDGRFAVPHGTDRSLSIEYWRYPVLVTGDTADSTALDNRPEVHEAIKFYVASGLVLYDDPYRSSVFKQEYEQRLARLREPLWLERGAIINLYE